MVRTIDAHDHHSTHDATLTGFDTADPTHPLGRRGDLTTTVYDGFDRVFTTFDPMGYQSRTGCTCGSGGGGENTYDPDGNALVQAAIGPETGDTRGGVADVLLSRTRFRHDELSRVYRTEQERFAPAVPLGTGQSDPRVTVYATATLFDRNGRVVRTTRPLGDFVERFYDGLDRVTMRRTNPMTGPAGTFAPSEVLTRYDAAGNAVQVEERERNLESGALERYFTDTFYDALGRAELRVSPHFADNSANATRTEYDSRSNAVATLDANGSTTDTVQVDRGGSRTLTVNGTGNAVLQLHDGLGRVVQTIRELRADHDGAGALQGDVVTKQDWDASSRLRSVTDDNGNTTRFSYDELDRRTVQTNADGEVQVTAYDRDGLVTSFVDENGTTTTQTYDDLGRTLTLSAIPAPSNPHGVQGPSAQTCAWDGLSRKVFCSDDNGGTVLSEVSNSYDSLSRLIASEQRVAGSVGLVEAEFDANSNLVRVTYPGRLGGGGRRQVTYGYQDENGATLNRIEQIEEGAGMSGTALRPVLPTGSAAARIAAFSYIGPMRVASRRYGDGVTGLGVLMTKGYDALRRNVTVTHEHSSLGGTFASFGYAFDRAGNRLNEVFGHEGVQDVYRYDSLGRLVREDRSAALGGIVNNQVANPIAVGAADARTWEFDGANNWKEVLGSGAFPSLSITANEMNEYEFVNGVSRSHDDNGNLVDDGTNEYVYDAFNRLVQVKRGATIYARYAYDHEGRRIARDVNWDLDPAPETFEEQVRYRYLGGSALEETDSAGNAIRQYVWGGGALLQFRASASIGLYCHENGYGSILRTTAPLSDGMGGVIQELADERDYNAFGEVSYGGSDTGLPYAFRCLRVDVETELLALGAGTAFSAVLGRSISRTGGFAAALLYNGFAVSMQNTLIATNVCSLAGLTIIPLLPQDVFTSNACGPDVTDYLLEELRRTMRYLKRNNWLDNWNWSDSGEAIAETGGRFFIMAGVHDYKFDSYESSGCPTAACKGGVTLCGSVCLHKSELGRIAAGFAAALSGVPDADIFTEITGVAGEQSEADIAGNSAGFDVGTSVLRTLRAGGFRAALTTMSRRMLCAAVESQASGLSSVFADRHCIVCPQEFPRSSWIHHLDPKGRPHKANKRVPGNQ